MEEEGEAEEASVAAADHSEMTTEVEGDSAVNDAMTMTQMMRMTTVSHEVDLEAEVSSD